jgi:hypothetical protein
MRHTYRYAVVWRFTSKVALEADEVKKEGHPSWQLANLVRRSAKFGGGKKLAFFFQGSGYGLQFGELDESLPFSAAQGRGRPQIIANIVNTARPC